MSEKIEPFEIRVPESVLEDLQERLTRTRFPDQLEGADWGYGTELSYLRGLCEYWRDKYDWRTWERRLNSFAHFRTSILGSSVHFIHQRSTDPNAVPLLLLHGWPGSFFNFYKVIDALVDPPDGTQGGPFHIVCPSLPGYGFSDPPREPGFDVRAMAETLAKLMSQLGYTRYGIQGGDWGAILASHLGLIDASRLCGIHLNMVVAGPPAGEDATAGLDSNELAALAEMAEFRKEETGYQAIQGTRPQTLGYALNDSPAGLAAWIVEKFRAWSDCGGDPEQRFTKDELLTNIMIYWASASITSSMRLYCESRRSGRFGLLDQRVEVPTGCALFPKEIFRPPRRWAEATYNVTRWTEMPAGGHFPALEEPERLIDDIRAFFNTVR
ncbi:MAG: epoxide hydrolase family protein [Myxococcota bacterium]